jgi:monovalent cation/proton antiporter MnhG/PhaG subunit
MDLTTAAVGVLVTVGVAVELACCAGVVVMGDVYDKLHFTGPATILGPLALAGAIVVREGLSQAGIKALLIAALLLVANPVLTHATGRALYIRQRDHLEPAEDTSP